MKIGFIAACSVICAVSTPLAAQDVAPVFDIGGLTNTLTIPTEVPRGDAPAGREVRLTYTVTPALQREALDGYISRVARGDPAAAKLVAAQFAKHDAGKIYRGISAPYGLRDNDAADVLTAYTVLGWLIATGAPDPSPTAVRAARRQIAAGLAANSQLSGPGTRAQLGEELKLLFVTLHAGWQSARREGKLATYSDGVAKMFKAQSGRDLRDSRLTEDGFSRR